MHIVQTFRHRQWHRWPSTPKHSHSPRAAIANELTLIRRSCTEPDRVGRPQGIGRRAMCLLVHSTVIECCLADVWHCVVQWRSLCVVEEFVCAYMFAFGSSAVYLYLGGTFAFLLCVCPEICVTHTNTHEHMNTFIPTIQSRIILVYIHIMVGLCVLLWSAIFLNVYPRDEYAIRIMHSPHKRDTKDCQYQLASCASGMEISREYSCA